MQADRLRKDESAAETTGEPAAPATPTERQRIGARCERYACRLCRTKTGWPHQVWCELAHITQPECGDCRYWNEKKHICDHPLSRRERAAK